MFYDTVNEEYYINLMKAIKTLNYDYIELLSSDVYKKCVKRKEYKGLLVELKAQNIIDEYKKIYNYHKYKKMWKSSPYNINDINLGIEDKPNYFINDRIAIYTVIFGDYDIVREPFVIPDNCDFYIIKDQINDNESNTVWKSISRDKYEKHISGLNNVEKNRFFKIHPHIIFPDYKYSIYIDGNIQPISDLTEFVNRISNYGMAFHRHSVRDCVYEEAETLKLFNIDKTQLIENQINCYIDNGMPKHYGLVECPVIAREHNKDICIRIMHEWWSEFLKYTRRDQLSLPYVLYKNNVNPKDISLLGNNVNKNTAIRRHKHHINK